MQGTLTLTTTAGLSQCELSAIDWSYAYLALTTAADHHNGLSECCIYHKQVSFSCARSVDPAWHVDAFHYDEDPWLSLSTAWKHCGKHPL